MEPNQVHLVAAAVLCDSQQIILVSSASSDLLDGSEPAPTVDQFIAPGNRDQNEYST